VLGFPVQITLTRYGYSTGYKIKILFIIQYVFHLENTVTWYNNNPVSGFPVQILHSLGIDTILAAK
jgi:hypothetical protein